MDKKLTDFESSAQKIAEFTGDTTFIKKGIQLTKERDELLNYLNDLEEFNVITKFQEVESKILETEAEFISEIKVHLADIEKEIAITKAQFPEKLEKQRGHLIESTIEARKTSREIARLVGDNAQKFDVALDKKTIDLMIEVTDEDYQITIKGLSDSKIWYEKTLRQYQRARRNQRLALYGTRGFWSILIGTIGAGAVIGAIPIWALSTIAFPVGAWWLQEKYFNRWIDKKMLKRRQQNLKDTVINLYSTRIKAEIYIAIDKYLIKSYKNENKSVERA